MMGEFEERVEEIRERRQQAEIPNTFCIKNGHFDDGFVVPQFDEDTMIYISGCWFEGDLEIPEEVWASGRATIHNCHFTGGGQITTYDGR